MAKQFIIIDGSSLVHRAFYALPTLTTSNGLYTNAVYGLTNMLLRLLSERHPDRVAVAFDKGKVTFRNADYAEYKAQRKPTPSELSEQFPAAREMLTALGVPVLELEGFEADDIIGTLANRAAAEGYEVVIVTGDRDALQLIGPQVRVLLTKRGISEFEEVDLAALQFSYSLTPEQVIDMKGLMGDASDNIPGVPGVGEVTAKKLIAEFGSLDNVYEHLDQVAGEKLRQKLADNRELAFLSRKLATIVLDVPVPSDIEKFVIVPDREKIRAAVEKFEFRALAARIAALFSTPNEQEQPCAAETQAPARPVVGVAEFLPLAQAIRKEGVFFFQAVVEGDLPARRFVGAALSVGGEVRYVAAGSPAAKMFLELLADQDLPKVTHDAKPVYNICQAAGLAFRRLESDTLIAAYLINPTASDYRLERLLGDFLGLPVPSVGNFCPADYAAWSVSQLRALHSAQQAELQRIGAVELARTIELPLIEVLSAMEVTGIRVDAAGLDLMDAEIARRISILLQSIFEAAGEAFNVNSTKQLGVILFEKLNLPSGRKTKTGYSTDADVLEKLAGVHPIIDNLLEYRMLTKLKSTYLEGLRPLINSVTGRIHTHFNQTVTATGRLSSSDPNLQNIPIRTETGKKIRTLFVPGEGYDFLLSADYSQIELRVLAHLADDASFIESFRSGEDIHTRTAAEVFGTPLAEVTPEMRSRAKAVNFGIVYGISDYGLSQGTGVSRKEAGEYITGYFARYPAVKAFIDRTVAEARLTGYVSTLFGRRRYLPDINSQNYNLRAFAERTAMNTPVQGTAADIIKKAMIDVQNALREQCLKSRLLLQVHDELVIEVVWDELAQVTDLVRSCMEQAAALSVPLSVDVKYGDNWAQTK